MNRLDSNLGQLQIILNWMSNVAHGPLVSVCKSWSCVQNACVLLRYSSLLTLNLWVCFQYQILIYVIENYTDFFLSHHLALNLFACYIVNVYIQAFKDIILHRLLKPCPKTRRFKHSWRSWEVSMRLWMKTPLFPGCQRTVPHYKQKTTSQLKMKQMKTQVNISWI